MKAYLQKIQTGLLFAIVFLLPWQSRWVFGFESIAEETSQYTIVGIFVVQALVLMAFALYPFVAHHHAHDRMLLGGWLMVTVVFASVWHADLPLVAASRALEVLAAFLLFLLLLRPTVSTRSLLLTFAAGLVAPALLGIFQTITGTSPAFASLGLPAREAATLGDAVVQTYGSRSLRAYGSFPHPNVFGGYLAVVAIAVGYMLASAKQRAQKSILGVLLVLFVFTLALTFSRSAWIGFGVSAVIAVWLLHLQHRHLFRQALPIVAAVLGSIVVAFWLFSPLFLARIDGNLPLEERSISERVEGYRDWYATIDAGDVATGMGVGQYVSHLANRLTGTLVEFLQPVHNTYLLLFAELGLVGAIVVAWWIGSIDRLNFKALPRPGAIAALAMGNVLLFIGFFDHYLWSLWSGLTLVALVMAMTVRLSDARYKE